MINTLLQRLDRLIRPDRAEQLAKEHGWRRRRGKISAFEFVFSAVGQASALDLTLNAQASSFTEPVTRQAVDQRYNAPAVQFFQAAFQECLATVRLRHLAQCDHDGRLYLTLRFGALTTRGLKPYPRLTCHEQQRTDHPCGAGLAASFGPSILARHLREKSKYAAGSSGLDGFNRDRCGAVNRGGLFVLAAKELAAIAKLRGLDGEAKTCLEESARMEETVRRQGWDGEWFLRAYDDFGHKIGSKECAEGKIFIETQGVCGLAGIGLEDGTARQALDSTRRHLATPHGIILQQPAYSGYHLELGEISSYPPGYKENAGIFCHNNPWVMIAEAMAGDGDNAHDYYSRINPSAREGISDVHRCEPYVYAQMIAGRDAPTHGEAKNSWLTGTAAWNADCRRLLDRCVASAICLVHAPPSRSSVLPRLAFLAALGGRKTPWWHNQMKNRRGCTW